MIALSCASRLSVPAFSTSRDCSARVCSETSRRFSLIRFCRSSSSCSRRLMRSSSRLRRLLPRSCSRLLPASSWRRSCVCASSLASSAFSWLRRSLLSGLLASRPLFRMLLISWLRVWLPLISAWARSGRVCAVITRLLASMICFCHSLSCALRSASNCSSCGSVLLP